jgi:hypothetical protein
MITREAGRLSFPKGGAFMILFGENDVLNSGKM